MSTLEKAAFLVGFGILAWFYGFATSARQWFPNDLLVRAWNQAESALSSSPPSYMTSKVYNRTGVRMVDRNEVDPAPTLILSSWKDHDWDPGIKLIGMDGRTLHEWRADPEKLFPDPPENRARRNPNSTQLHGSYLYPNGDIVVNVSYIGVARLDACSNLLWRLPAGNHHSIERADDGSFWISGGSWQQSREERELLSSRPTVPRDGYYDRLIHVSEDGEVLHELSVLGIIYRNGLERYIPKGSMYPPTQIPPDITHLNDVEPLSAAMADEHPLFDAGDLLVSLREIDLVMVVDPEFRTVKWHATDPFIQQHDPDFLDNGWIGVFDNNRDGTERGTRLGGSRIVLLQPHTDSMRVIFPSDRSDPFHTEVQGEWQQLDNGNLLLTESQAGRVVEVSPDGRTLWEWIANPYDESTVPEVSDAIRYDLNPQEVASWPCSPGETEESDS